MSQLVTAKIEALRPYEGGKPLEELVRELGVHDAIKLASNENPLGPSPKAIEAVQRLSAGVHRYPDAAAHRLREKLAARHGVTPAEVIQGAGSNEVIELVVRTFATHEHHMVFGEPGFSMYPIIAMAHGVAHTAVPTRDLKHDLSAMLDAVRPNTRLLIVDNPNNPTGTYASREAVEKLLRSVPEQVVVIMDEAYFEYAEAEDYPNSLELRHLRERLLVTRTFSKIYGLAALRVGYGIGPAKLLDYINRIRAPFNVGTLSQEAALAALDDNEHLETSRKLNRTERERLTRELYERGLKVTPSQANFLLVDLLDKFNKLDTQRPGRALYQALLHKGIIVRPFDKLPTSLRITVGTPEENTRFLKGLDEVLQ